MNYVKYPKVQLSFEILSERRPPPLTALNIQIKMNNDWEIELKKMCSIFCHDTQDVSNIFTLFIYYEVA
jgi:hypothetical protein